MAAQQGRALQILRLRSIARECSAINCPEKIPGLWIAHRRFRHNQCDRAIRVKAASRQVTNFGFCRDANHQTDNDSGNSSILESDVSVLVRPHANVKLLGGRIVCLRRIRVPDNPPPAAGWDRVKFCHFHLEQEIGRAGRFADGNGIDRE